MSDATERWLPVAGWEDRYEISDRGRVKSLRHLLDGTLLIHLMKLQPNRDGHLQVHLSSPGRRVTAYVHQLVLEAFAGPCPPGELTRHLNGDPADNRWPENICWGTPPENGQDMVRHGRTQAGSKHHLSTLTRAEIADIRAAWQRGARVTDLAARYGVSKPTISRIVNGRAYRDTPVLPRPPEKCHYPRCGRDARPGRNRQGHVLMFCDNPKHDRYSAKKERSRLYYLER